MSTAASAACREVRGHLNVGREAPLGATAA